MSTGVRVAVVDDEEPVRRGLGRLLRLAHYDVTLFSSGEEFLASLDARRPDCMVLDVSMPGVSGLDVQRRLRSVSIRIPAICISGGEDGALLREVQEAGIDCLLHKPFSNTALLEAIRVALSRGHLTKG
jgi:FixJ family two-component response regulator